MIALTTCPAVAFAVAVAEEIAPFAADSSFDAVDCTGAAKGFLEGEAFDMVAEGGRAEGEWIENNRTPLCCERQ